MCRKALIRKKKEAKIMWIKAQVEKQQVATC